MTSVLGGHRLDNWATETPFLEAPFFKAPFLEAPFLEAPFLEAPVIIIITKPVFHFTISLAR